MSKFRLICAVLFALFSASAVYAADITLSSRCTLADAIIAANHDRAEGGCRAGRGADTITLSQDITLRAELPAITSAITIEGEGYTISGSNRYRIFYNDGGALTINGLTMTKGRAENKGELISNADGTLKATEANPVGGAIVNWAGELSISESSFSGNSAEWGGAIYNAGDGELSIINSSFSRNSAERGGAIDNAGELDVTNSAFQNNLADRGGAIYNAEELSISDSTFSDNSAEYGGAIGSAEELSISDSTFSDNSAVSGGAIYNWEELDVTNSTFSDNSASGAGGAIANGGDGELSISDSTFSDNSAGKSGGAIYNWEELDVTNSTFSRNSAEGGGAIFNEEELGISASAFSGNSAEGGGAIVNGGDGELSISSSTFSDNSASEAGGAIANDKDGELSITNSTFSGNSADWGGAIYNWEELDVTSSTFSDNSAAEGGGAIFNDKDGELSTINNTFSDNSAGKNGSAIYNAGELSMINSIIAGRGGDTCYSEGRLKQNIRNFIQDGSCSPAFSGDPKLGRLVVPEDGSPAYFPLLAGSRAIDAADDDYCPATDQIGTTRPQGAGCDIGAIDNWGDGELSMINSIITPSPIPEPSPTPTPTPLPEGFVEAGNPNEIVLDALIEILPQSLPAGKVQWKWDYSRSQDGVENIRGIRGTAAGKRVHFRTQEGGLMSLNFAVFDTTEEAAANYERILGIRSVLENGKPKDNFPQPNIFGSGLYGSVAIFQIDNYFIEVFIEIFIRGNPLEPLSRETIRFFEKNRSAFEAAAGD